MAEDVEVPLYDERGVYGGTDGMGMVDIVLPEPVLDRFEAWLLTQGLRLSPPMAMDPGNISDPAVCRIVTPQ